MWSNTKILFMYRWLLSFILLVSFSVTAQTIGLITHTSGVNDDGYLLFAPITNTTTYLVDKCGKQVHSWNSTYRPGQSVYLLADGTLLRTGNAGNTIFTAGGNGGVIQKIDWSGSVLWSYTLSDTAQCQHHDVVALPNGNILAIVWELRSVTEAVAAGRNPSLLGSSLWSEKVLELQPVGSTGANIVWEWHAWDHLVQDYDASKSNYGTVSSSPGLININYSATTTTDWLHLNSIDYNPSTDQVMISCHNFSEIWVIDHSTSTAQAAGHTGGDFGKGGDILYRWGNPAAYNTGAATDEKLWGQHNAHWITSGPDSGKIMIFNNGHGLSPATNYSSVDIIQPPVDAAGFYTATLPYLPASTSWTYQATVPTDFFATNISGAQQLPNGNVLICNGPAGEFFEIDTAKQTVWKYINPVKNTGPMSQGTTPTQNLVFRCAQYSRNYSGFAGHTLVAGDPIELNPLSYTCDVTAAVASPGVTDDINIFPVPAHDKLTITGLHGDANVLLYDVTGRQLHQSYSTESSADLAIDTHGLLAGTYIIEIQQEHHNYRKIVIIN